MPDPRSLYEEKKTTYESLVAGLHPGMLLQVGQLGGEPRGFLRALGSHGDHLRDMGILIHNVFEPYQFLFRPDVTILTGFLSDVTRAAAKEVGNVHYLGLQYCEGARLTRVAKNAADLFAICLGPMDDDGYFNFGLLSSSEYELTHTLAKDPRSRVLVEANAHVPHVHGFEEHGAHRIHISEIDHVVEADEPLMELPAPEPSEIETRMAGHVADLVEDGATIQLGFGGLPNTIAKLLKDKRDLGAHSEMMGDGILELIAGPHGLDLCSRLEKAVRLGGPQRRLSSAAGSRDQPPEHHRPATQDDGHQQCAERGFPRTGGGSCHRGRCLQRFGRHLRVLLWPDDVGGRQEHPLSAIRHRPADGTGLQHRAEVSRRRTGDRPGALRRLGGHRVGRRSAAVADI